MSQNDFVIANDTANAVRLDIESAFQALASNNSLDTEPPTPYANQWWYDTSTSLLKIRNGANTDWIIIGEIDQNTASFAPYVGAFKVFRMSAAKIGFEAGGSTKMSLDTGGNLITTGNITAYGTP